MKTDKGRREEQGVLPLHEWLYQDSRIRKQLRNIQRSKLRPESTFRARSEKVKQLQTQKRQKTSPLAKQTHACTQSHAILQPQNRISEKITEKKTKKTQASLRKRTPTQKLNEKEDHSLQVEEKKSLKPSDFSIQVSPISYKSKKSSFKPSKPEAPLTKSKTHNDSKHTLFSEYRKSKTDLKSVQNPMSDLTESEIKSVSIKSPFNVQSKSASSMPIAAHTSQPVNKKSVLSKFSLSAHSLKSRSTQVGDFSSATLLRHKLEQDGKQYTNLICQSTIDSGYAAFLQRAVAQRSTLISKPF